MRIAEQTKRERAMKWAARLLAVNSDVEPPISRSPRSHTIVDSDVSDPRRHMLERTKLVR